VPGKAAGPETTYSPALPNVVPERRGILWFLMKLGNIPLVHDVCEPNTLWISCPRGRIPGPAVEETPVVRISAALRSYGVGIAALTWFENVLSVPSLATAVVT
jgi:hypothetical protein